MKLRLVPVLLAFALVAVQNLHAQADYTSAQDDDGGIDTEFLDGYVGLGGAVVSGLSSEDKGTREAVRVEFARLRKWISLDARVGFGGGYTDFGALFRVYRHWKFTERNSTGISFGAGLGAMYSPGLDPLPGGHRVAFIDVMGAPFVRYVWDWGMGMGLGADLEYQLVPYTTFTNKQDSDTQSNITTLRSRIFFGLSLLLEVDQ